MLVIVSASPFKLTCVVYGYTVVGKGTTLGLWKEVSREAQVYHTVRPATSKRCASVNILVQLCF
jgi:hypothetical protein